MATLLFNGKHRKHGDVFGVVENEERRFYLVTWSAEQDALELALVPERVLATLAPNKYEVALKDIYPLWTFGAIGIR